VRLSVPFNCFFS